MRVTLDTGFELNKRIKQKPQKKIKNFPKRKRVFNELREDTAPENSEGRTL